MKTEALNDCLRILNTWRELDDESRTEIVMGRYGFGQNYIRPFRLELVENILSKTSPQEKRN